MRYWKKHKWPLLLMMVIIGYSCASMGTPDGGPYDEMPPKFVGSSPRLHAVNVKDKKIELEFDEFIKLEKPSEKVVVSPPQLEQPEIKVVGKKVVAQLFDTLKHATTYTIDFSDAIVDNNEGNPMGNFTYSFSTGATIDTMEVSGAVLNAEDLEPIKGIQVGLHMNLNDSALNTLPFDRVSRTDSRGRFSIRGVASGKYRIYALMDGNQNYLYDSKTETVAFSDSIIIPSMMPATRQDTLWKDTLTIDTIKTVGYTRFMPDDIILRAFKEENTRQYLSRKERDKENHFILTFSAKADTLPTLKGLNFDEKDAFVIEANEGNDSICYWVKDSLVYQMDTLAIQVDYLYTDTLDQLVPKTDTLYLANKLTREQRDKLKKQEEEKKEKERKKREKKGEAPKPEPTLFLKMNVDAPSAFDINRNVVLSFDEPLARIDTSSIHVSVKEDTLWVEKPFILVADSVIPRRYEILADWQPDREYQLKIDSTAITGLYGLHTDKVDQSFKVKKLDEYGTLFFNIRGVNQPAIVELLDAAGKVIRQQRVTPEGTADFYYLAPNTKYYVRMFMDRNGNGKWDTGNVEKRMQPEEVYYLPKSWEMKANFDFEETWDIHLTPVDKQKLDEIKKQKPEEVKKVQERNKERAKKLGRTS
ncbi:MAG: Ig-like domain-containing protein [Bacteroidaceae bacterium]|nr:Ig-like domain-containing protein [Bacteroidaceae bacterium]